MIINPNTNPETITQFHDELSNELPELKGQWSFSFKIFRNNPASIPPELANQVETSPESKFLHTLSPSYLKGSCICLVDKKSSSVFTNVINEEVESAANDNTKFIPDQHLHKGATTGLNDSFDTFLTQRLPSLWSLRQNIRGDGGEIYQLENENLTIKTSNVFLHGIFKGLLIEITVDDHIVSSGASDYLNNLFQSIITKYSIPCQGKLCCDVLDSRNLDSFGDLCLQYSEILNF